MRITESRLSSITQLYGSKYPGVVWFLLFSLPPRLLPHSVRFARAGVASPGSNLRAAGKSPGAPYAVAGQIRGGLSGGACGSTTLFLRDDIWLGRWRPLEAAVGVASGLAVVAIDHHCFPSGHTRCRDK